MPRNWSRIEVEETVASYLKMLRLELRGESYNKSSFRRRLSRLLEGRSDRAIEDKHMNISAVLNELSRPGIAGYKPLPNYQGLLREVVIEALLAEPALDVAIEESLEEVVPEAVPDDILSIRKDPPKPRHQGREMISEKRDVGRSLVKRDYLGEEARNRAIGACGEKLVLAYERARLQHAGKESLADQIEHVSVELGDGAGFDIRSFETNGTDRLIEVKTTGYAKETPIYVSNTELEVSRHKASVYHLYRAFQIRRGPGLFVVKGSFDETCLLEPTQFRGRLV